VVLARRIVAGGSFSVFESWWALSHANIFIRQCSLSVSSVTLVFLFIPSIVGTIFRTFHLLNIDALCLGIWVNISEGESRSISWGTSFEALCALRLLGRRKRSFNWSSLRSVWLRNCIIGFLDQILELSTVEECVDDTLKTLATLNHVHHKWSLEISVILWHIVNELLKATADSADQVVVLEITGNSCMTNKVESVTNM